METNDSASSGLTERQQFWLDHIARCDAAGSSTKDYAAAHDLSVLAMYSARKDLVERGALLPGGRGVRVAASRSRFSRAVRSGQDTASAAALTVQLQSAPATRITCPATRSCSASAWASEIPARSTPPWPR